MNSFKNSLFLFAALLLLGGCVTTGPETEEEFVLQMETTRQPVDLEKAALLKNRKFPDSSQILFLPQPRQVQFVPGIYLESKVSPTIRFDASQLKAQGYELTVCDEGIFITAADEAGLFYARQTLRQLERYYEGSNRLPAVHIEDWPDYPHRGVLLDIARDKIPTLETLYEYIDLLSHLKFNQLQLYMEHSFAYPGHEVVWQDASPLTAEDIRALDRYCADRHMELVPNQNSFGHMERWLRHEKYAHLAEIPGRSDLCATHPESILLLKDMYNHMLPCFSSKQVNVGCDETFTLGQGASREVVAELGKGRVYLNFLTQISELVAAHGKTMQFWGDIILEHPELIAELPKNVIAMEWGYEANHPFNDRGEHFARSGIPYYVCPGTSSWNSLLGRTDNALANLERAAASGLQHGAIGYLITDWGDSGHWQFPSVSYLPFARGASLSWAYEANLNQDLTGAVDVHIFHDDKALLSQSLFDLGNAHQLTGASRANSTAFYGWLLYAMEGDPADGFFK